jgi:hypothetical protein
MIDLTKKKDLKTMKTLNKKEEKALDKLLLLKQLQQRLEDSWSGFTQVIEEAEEFIEDVKEAEEKEIIEFKDVEELEIFYEDYIDNLKFQAEGLQAESQIAIDKFRQKFNIEEEV